MPARQCSLSRESFVVLCLVTNKKLMSTHVNVRFPVASQCLQMVVEMRGSIVRDRFRFQCFASMMVESGPSTIGIDTHNIETNVACLGSFCVFNHVSSVAAVERKAGRAASGLSCDLFQLLCNPS